MRADHVIKSMLEKEQVSTIEASKALGKSRGYLSSVIAQRVIPKADTLAAICNVLGYDLIARSRVDGYEFTIDPPERGDTGAADGVRLR